MVLYSHISLEWPTVYQVAVSSIPICSKQMLILS